MHCDDELPIDPDLAPHDPGERRVGARRGMASTRRRGRARPDVLVAIACGGAIGTTLRAGLGQLSPVASPQFPATTLGINLVGSFALGLIVVVLVERFGPAPRLQPFLTTGILGGFTTFSTFTVDSVQLVRHDRIGTALEYVAVSTIVGVAAALVGIAAGRWFVERSVLEHRGDDAIGEAESAS